MRSASNSNEESNDGKHGNTSMCELCLTVWDEMLREMTTTWDKRVEDWRRQQ
jgi:hypothetical protein